MWPVALGPMARPSRFALTVYVACVAGELALISLGSRALTAAGDGDLRPALISAVVGLHFIPFAWAFRERMFCWFGGLLCGLGATGLLAGAMGVAHAADALAVLSGLVMLTVITVYARGRRVGSAPSDFAAALPAPDSELAQQPVRDPACSTTSRCPSGPRSASSSRRR